MFALYIYNFNLRSMHTMALYFALLCNSLTHYRTAVIELFPKNKNQLDVTYYFIVILIGSTCFGHYYAHHQDYDFDYHIGRFVLGLLYVGGYVRLEYCPGCSPDIFL